MAADEKSDAIEAGVGARVEQAPVEVRRTIGPARLYCVARFFLHPLNWLGSVFWAFDHLSFVRVSLWHRLSLVPLAQDKLVSFYYWQHHLLMPMWLPFAAAGCLHCLILWWCISYEMGDSALFVRSGPLVFGSPGGFFKAFDNPVYYSMIIHVDCSRGLLNLIFHTGTIIIRAADGNLRDHHLLLTHVSSPKRVVSELLAVAGGGNARILTTTR